MEPRADARWRVLTPAPPPPLAGWAVACGRGQAIGMPWPRVGGWGVCAQVGGGLGWRGRAWPRVMVDTITRITHHRNRAGSGVGVTSARPARAHAARLRLLKRVRMQPGAWSVCSCLAVPALVAYSRNHAVLVPPPSCITARAAGEREATGNRGNQRAGNYSCAHAPVFLLHFASFFCVWSGGGSGLRNSGPNALLPTVAGYTPSGARV